MNRLTVNELFSGIGSQRKALDNLHINHEVIGISEIDEPAIKSYETIFDKTRNYGDISKINKLDYADFWTYSFPCTDISTVGKMEGIKEGNHSGLLLEVKRLLQTANSNNELPKYLMLENVKALVNSKNKPDFDEWLNYLENLGYNNYWKVINATDVSVPQNRQRVFVISILKEFDNGFYFKEPNGYIKDIRDYLLDGYEYDDFVVDDMKVDSKIKRGCKLEFQNKYDEIISSTKDIYDCRAKTDFQDKKVGIKYSPTLKAQNSNVHVLNGKRVQRVKPQESWRLMGFSDEDYFKAKSTGISDTQLYKQAGNSIVVDVLMSIFEVLFKDYIID